MRKILLALIIVTAGISIGCSNVDNDVSDLEFEDKDKEKIEIEFTNSEPISYSSVTVSDDAVISLTTTPASTSITLDNVPPSTYEDEDEDENKVKLTVIDKGEENVVENLESKDKGEEKEEEEEELMIAVTFDEELSSESIASYEILTADGIDTTAAKETDDEILVLNVDTSTVQTLTVVDFDTDSYELQVGYYFGDDSINYNFDKSLDIINTDYDGDLSIFSDFKNLKKLRLRNRTNLDGIKQCKQIEILSLFTEAHEDWEVVDILKVLVIDLDNISHVKSLDISGYTNGEYVRFVDSTSQLNLENLSLSIADFKNINALNNCLSLINLSIDNCDVDNSLLLSNFKNIESIANTAMIVNSDPSIISFEGNFVEGLTKLKYLSWYEASKSTPYGLDELKELATLKLSGFKFDGYDIGKTNPNLSQLTLLNSSLDKLIIRDNTSLTNIDIRDSYINDFEYEYNPNLDTGYIAYTVIKNTYGFDEFFSNQGINTDDDVLFGNTYESIDAAKEEHKN